jgi:cathepsin L
MVLLGYGHNSTSKVDYWKLKNSMGVGWGDRGYLYILRKSDGKGICGVQEELYTALA